MATRAALSPAARAAPSVPARAASGKCPVGGPSQPEYCMGTKISSERAIEWEGKYAAKNYKPLPVVFHNAQGVHAYDPEGRHYFDFLSAYSAVNQGHCHPRIIGALVDQAQRCTLSSRAFYNDVFPRFAKFVTEFFGYDRVLPMNGGVEAVETAVKLSRRWAYDKKGVSPNEAIIVACEESFHGRTLTAISMSTDPSARDGFGPFLPGIIKVPHGDVNALREVFERDGKRIAAFLVEPIQGEAGIVVPPPGYLGEVQALCKEHKILLICDEIQTGLARTGKMLAQEWDDARADITLLGKAISGGVLPLSAVLASNEVMLTIKPGEHGSTYGGNPLASAVGIAALTVLKEEKMMENALRQGNRLRAALSTAPTDVVKLVRGRGLLNAIVIRKTCKVSANEICYMLKDAGLLAKPTHETIIRLAPPLVINDAELEQCIEIIMGVLQRAEQKHRELSK